MSIPTIVPSAKLSPLPVLIIGSGLGGLNLAQSLQRQKIPYKIFERDAAQEQRAQGYRISISDTGTRGLQTALSPELFQVFLKTCAQQHRPGGRVDGPSGQLLQGGVIGLLGAGGWGMAWKLGKRFAFKRWEKWTLQSWSAWLWTWIVTPVPTMPVIPPAPAGSRHQVDRRVLRSILLQGQSKNITYDSAFVSYTVHPDSVIAHFANGTSVAGSLLVGADGIRSRVASQLIGEPASPIDLGARIIYGKTMLTEQVERRLHPILQRGVSFVVNGDPRLTLVLESMRFNRSPDIDLPQDYIFWALVARAPVYKMEDSKLTTLLAHDAAELSQRSTSHWDPRIRVIFDEQDKDQTAVLRVTASEPDKPVRWKTERRVTVLGDAVHCMPPTGGQGANSALYDAALLGMALSEVTGEDGREGWSEQTIDRYQDAMRYNIGDIVGMACIGANCIF